ncbi:hypothetical protein JOC93_000199 [Priestia taiwanensis]|uniref:DUF3952 domain-containing protein n=2 Tax=Priestia taiwanensis TaxID=1347902 RepID=A0A917EKV4_9BACI|nr:hypothetical protein [Priestia taiwanensis]GGE55268.1 hypothetical protein GCM10007140_02000 [Priestia taiwanensis]
MGETKIEYERLVKALDEGDMATVMSASDDGYAYVEERVIESERGKKEGGEYGRTLYQNTNGVYNINERVLYGYSNQEIVNKAADGKESNKGKEDIYSTKIIYEDNLIRSDKGELNLSPIRLNLDIFSGLEDLKPKNDKVKYNEPNRIGYTLSETEFNNILNDNLKLTYDKFDSASITVGFNKSKDTDDKEMLIEEINIVVWLEKGKEDTGKSTHLLEINWSFPESSNKNINMKEKYLEIANN